jgi:hypothetical protein
MAMNFPPFDCSQILKLRNNKVKKEITAIVFEILVENTPTQMVEETGEKATSFQ